MQKFLLKNRKKELTTEQKKYNHELSKKRIKVENVIREVTIFKILSERYRNRRKNYSIKTNIVAGIVNTQKRRLRSNHESDNPDFMQLSSAF